MYGSGIPQRIERRTGRRCTTLINGEFDKDIGSYVLFPEAMEPPFTPRLGVVLAEAKGIVRVREVAPGSPAARAGIQSGDVLQTVAGWMILSVPDVKIALFDKKPGESATVIARRRAFPFGSHSAGSRSKDDLNNAARRKLALAGAPAPPAPPGDRLSP